MKTKHIVPIVAGGILCAGSTIYTHSKNRRLLRLVSAKDNQITTLEKIIDDYKAVIAAKDEVIAKHKEYVEVLERAVEKDKEMITRQKEKLEELQIQPKALNEAEGGNPPRKNGREYFFQYDMDLNLVAKYETSFEACVGSGIKDPGTINKVARGAAHTAGGYFWSKGQRPLKKFPDKWIEISKKKQK